MFREFLPETVNNIHNFNYLSQYTSFYFFVNILNNARTKKSADVVTDGFSFVCKVITYCRKD